MSDETPVDQPGGRMTRDDLVHAAAQDLVALVALVALVREWQEAVKDEARYLCGPEPESPARVFDINERKRAAKDKILAYPLPAAPRVPDTPVTRNPAQDLRDAGLLPSPQHTASVPDTPQGLDESRCAVCGWPLDPEGKLCLRGSCSQRPLPETAADPARAAAEYEAAGHRVEFSEALARWYEQADAAPPQEPPRSRIRPLPDGDAAIGRVVDE